MTLCTIFKYFALKWGMELACLVVSTISKTPGTLVMNGLVRLSIHSTIAIYAMQLLDEEYCCMYIGINYFSTHLNCSQPTPSTPQPFLRLLIVFVIAIGSSGASLSTRLHVKPSFLFSFFR